MKKYFKAKIKKAKIISFDIFDTLLLRNVPHPLDIFTIVEKKYKIPNFVSRRIYAEIKARKIYTHHETTYDEIYRFLPGICKEYELREERNALFANPDLIEIYEYAVELDKRIIGVSDMYLDKSFLWELLKEKGVPVSELFMSSEYKKSKAVGELFDVVLDSFGSIEANQIVHIGDNYCSDIVMARNKGIETLHYQYPYNNCIGCEYKKAIMEQTPESLQFAQKMRLDNKSHIVNSSDDFMTQFRCYLRWYIFSVRSYYYRCQAFNTKECIQKFFHKFFV